jgi:HD-GYP domain-containing protein (c-di-GMP phosphodiesterase class II)
VSTNRVKKPVIVAVLNDAQKSGTFGLRDLVGVVGGKTMVDDAVRLIVKWASEVASKDPKAPRPETLLRVKSGGKARTTESALGRGDGDYSRINTNLLLRVSPLKAPVYIRLSSTKYVKLFQEGDVFDTADLEKYLHTKKVDYFFLQNGEVAEFVSKLKDDLFKIIEAAAGSGPKLAKVQGEIGESVHETVKELIGNLGVTPEVQEVVRASVDMAVKAMGRSPRLAGLLTRLKADRKNYISSHSMMLGEISCAIAAAAGWHSEQTFYKLNLASFLHDITLKNNDLATVQTLEELTSRKLEFTDEELREFREHPSKAAELARQFTEVPPDVDVIIAQHHERPDGSGFPRGLTHSSISPLGAAFLVGHDLLLYILARGDSGWTVQGFLESVEGRYVGNNFRKIIKVMQDLKI